MSPRLGFLLAASLVALCACDRKHEAAPTKTAAVQAPAAQAIAAPPHRRPGLWAQTVSTAGMTQKSTLCVDAAVEAAMGWWGQQAASRPCARQSVTRGADGAWRIESQCDLGSAGMSRTTGVATGDFASAYRMDAQTITTGAAAPQMNGAHKMTLEAAWQGPCPASMKPGDITLPGGMKINLLEVAAAK